MAFCKSLLLMDLGMAPRVKPSSNFSAKIPLLSANDLAIRTAGMNFEKL
jgi:hypothetical protein